LLHKYYDDTNVSDAEEETRERAGSYKSSIKDFPINNCVMKTRIGTSSFYENHMNGIIEPKSIIDD
jgi:hypothetical protein